MSTPHPDVPGVRQIGPRQFAITSEPEARTPWEPALRHLKRWVLGAPLPSRLERVERLGILTAVALIGSDMIASSVYGPEEMVRHLGEAGPAGVAFALPVAIAIGALLAILTLSYRQTISAYPSGAGGYIVASENLGPLIGVVSAAALLIDYTLDIAVSIATGIQSLTSAVPQLAALRLPLCLFALTVITLANLRGIRAAGLLLSTPVYVYVIGTLAVVGFGGLLAVTNALPAYTPPAGGPSSTASSLEPVGILLLLRAFASGAVALTGVEAISNGVPYLKEPSTANARRALLLMAGLFASMFLGIAAVAGRLGVIADPAEIETVHSQVARTLIGTGVFFKVLEGSAVLMLILAVNTGFADFPRLLALLARDNYLPPAFSTRGSRLAFSNGILVVALLAGLLLIVFNGSVAGLAPLFTIGAFLTFTLSQSGMVRYWQRQHGTGWQWRTIVNAVGAATTALVLVVVLASKFLNGAWMVVIAVPVLTYAVYQLGQHQQRLVDTAQVSAERTEPLVEALASRVKHHILVPVADMDRVALNALAYVTSLVGDARIDHAGLGNDAAVVVQAVHITDDRNRGSELQQRWQDAALSVPLVILESPYRASSSALLRYVDYVLRADRSTRVSVVIPEVLPTRWWHPLLRNYLAWRLKWALLFRPGVSVVSVPLVVPD